MCLRWNLNGEVREEEKRREFASLFAHSYSSFELNVHSI